MNEWVQDKLGIKGLKFTSYSFPDLTATYVDEDKLVEIELEYEASNYNIHNHPRNGCDLIVSFVRKYNQKQVRGIPVWSFYKVDKEGMHIYCLDEDMEERNMNLSIEAL